MLEGEALVGAEIAGRYRVLRLLGEGGSSWVYEVEHLRTTRRHALKVLRPELAERERSVERFRREARTAAELGSRHIVGALDVGALDDGRPFILLELLCGETLRDRLRRERALPVGIAVDIALQCCRALEMAHGRGVVHRDLKPENLHLSSDASGELVVKVLDFGISKLTEDARDLAASSLTRTGVPLGTPWYMPPEQIDGSSELDHRADVYALGVVLFEMLTGQRPFGATSFTTLVLKVAAEPPPRPSASRPEVSAAIDDVVVRAMAKRPSDRFASAGALRDAICAAMVAPRARAPRRASAVQIAALAAVVPLALVSGAGPSPLTSLGQAHATHAAQPTTSARVERDASVETHEAEATRIGSPPAPASSGVAASPPAAIQPASSSIRAPVRELRSTRLHPARERISSPPDDEAAQTSTDATTGRAAPTIDTSDSTSRTVLLRNARRAQVHVSLRCAHTTVERTLLAGQSMPVRAPIEPCRAQCVGVGDPVCPSLLLASTTTFSVR